MGSTHSVTATIQQETIPQSQTTGNIAQHYEKLQNARPLYDPSSLPQRSNSVRTAMSIHPPSKLNLNAKLKKFATVAVTRLGLRQPRTDGKDQKSSKKTPVPLSQSFPQIDVTPEDPIDSKPQLTELEQLYQDMNIITRVNKSNIGLLLKAFGRFVVKLCAGMCLKPTAAEVAKWVISMDKSLQDCRWTNKNFVCESHIVFLFMLMEQYSRERTFLNIREVREGIHVCLFISYTYNANEISYPARPFLSLGQDRNKFFQECVGLGLGASSEMLEINQDQDLYRRHLTRLLTYTV
ncbi:Cyclin-dependent kinase 5 activator 1-like [Oopsacas minuta]|uniref:Cyclin-dependent kinase 5 activator 1-like n=1 Tax=Oopsacas minuta TaxID=111878 RepID=A0AAV7JJX4_9METZ|nr:Cyclin-dependent kinase 5 activator 1-like [Oopsacas minuta]